MTKLQSGCGLHWAVEGLPHWHPEAFLYSHVKLVLLWTSKTAAECPDKRLFNVWFAAPFEIGRTTLEGDCDESVGKSQHIINLSRLGFEELENRGWLGPREHLNIRVVEPWEQSIEAWLDSETGMLQTHFFARLHIHERNRWRLISVFIPMHHFYNSTIQSQCTELWGLKTIQRSVKMTLLSFSSKYPVKAVCLTGQWGATEGYSGSFPLTLAVRMQPYLGLSAISAFVLFSLKSTLASVVMLAWTKSKRGNYCNFVCKQNTDQ